MEKKVIIYSRVSTEQQTLEQQERSVNEWLKARNMTATEVVSDEGISGGVSYKDRNLGKIVLPKLKEGDMLIVSEISRLGRSMCDLSKLVNDELKPRRVRLVVVGMGIDLDCYKLTAMDELILNNFAFAGQLEKELIQARTQSALQVRKDKLAQDGSFISKSGRVCTHLGNEKGCKMNDAARASAQRRREQSQSDNKQLWATIQTLLPVKERYCNADYTELSVKLNAMMMRTPTGKEFTPERAKSCYHNLRRTFAA